MVGVRVPAGNDLGTVFAAAAALADSMLPTRCSSCFGSLGADDKPVYSCFGPCDGKVSYCSLDCHGSDVRVHSSSGECHFFTLISSPSETADLRTALRLINCSESHDGDRLGGLASNHSRIMEDTEDADHVKGAARLMQLARCLAGLDEQADRKLQEAFCVVITNGVQIEMYDHELPPVKLLLGTGLYRPGFSWINHSCRPNACYRFVMDSEDSSNLLELEPCLSWLSKTRPRHPRLVIRSVRGISAEQELTVSYSDLLKPKAERQIELQHRYKFVCSCQRCEASYSDMVLQSIGTCRRSSCSGFLFVDAQGNARCSQCGRTDASTEMHTEKELVKQKENAIKAFVRDGDAKRCCMLIEPALLDALSCEVSKNKSSLRLMSSTCLEALLVLKSAYRVLSSAGSDGYGGAAAGVAVAIATAAHHLYECGEEGVGIVAGSLWLEAGEALLEDGQRDAAKDCVRVGQGLVSLFYGDTHPLAHQADLFFTIHHGSV